MKLIKLAVACERLTVSRRTLDRLIAAGELTVVRVSPGRYAIADDQIDRYIAAKTVTATPIKLSKPRISIDTGGAEARLCARLGTRKADQVTAKKRGNR